MKAAADIFTIDPIKYKISEKIKKSFDPKRIFNPGKMYTYGVSNLLNNKPMVIGNMLPTKLNLINFFSSFSNILKDLTNFICIPSLITYSTISNSFFSLKTVIFNSLYFELPNPINTISTFYQNKLNPISTTNTDNTLVYNSETLNYSSFSELLPSSFSENSSS
jgi:hypothetical protein